MFISETLPIASVLHVYNFVFKHVLFIIYLFIYC